MNTERGVFSMTEIQIKLPPESVSTFIKKTQDCDFNVDIAYDHLEIDAKSLLGILSLDLNTHLSKRPVKGPVLFERPRDRGGAVRLGKRPGH